MMDTKKYLNNISYCLKKHELYGLSSNINEHYRMAKKCNKYDFIIVSGFTSKLFRMLNKFKGPLLNISDGCLRNDLRYGSKYPFLLSFNGPSFLGNFKYTDDLPSKRWDRWGIEVKPWKKGGDYILVGHQFAKRYGVNRIEKFKKIIEDLKGYNVRIRQHPKFIADVLASKECKGHLREKYLRDKNITFGEDLSKAKCMVTYDSAISVQAIFHGVPLIMYGKYMIMDPVSSPNVDNLRYPDRQSWLNWLGYQHWTIDELRTDKWLKYYKKIKMLPNTL